MQDWNVVINLNERGLKEAFVKLGRFGPVRKTGYFNVLSLKTAAVPEMLEALREVITADPGALSFLSRLVPVSETFNFQFPGEFEETAKKIVLKWTSQLEGKGFHVRMHRRGFKGKMSGLDEEHFLNKVLLDALDKTGNPGHITFSEPDYIIAVETISQWAGLSLWSREELRRYPFVRLD
jgi:tRNA(Ser,Leu) C12 N-acetylase TAN1